MSSIPNHATVLVVGGGPAGSYTASLLAREGVDVAVLEADVFPRYHIGESMLPTMRFFLRLIDAESTFDAQGFQKKFGASFKISEKAVAYSDFSITLGPGGHSWNVIRSQADQLLFQHASKQGAQTFDGVKVNEITFEPYEDDAFSSADLGMAKVANPGRPVAATWSRKDGSSGKITFDYLVDASGRAGIMSTKYLKNRNLNEGLKNIANWTYWKGAEKYGAGTGREGSPFFEALEDGSGWCWYIALHDGTISVGVVMRQDIFFAKKKKLGSPPPEELYKECLKLTPQISELLKNGEISSDIKMASDWSYNASAYAGPHFRMIGDAGCFIDPYFSSGVHLALSSGLSAALTIQASRNGECNEFTAAKWHSSKVREGYTRFLVVVMICLRQLRKPDHSILSGEDVDNYDAAFAAIQPVIQGTADAETANVPAQARAADTVKFALSRFQDQTPQQQREALTSRLEEVANKPEELEKLSEDEVRILNDMTSAHVAQISNEKSINELANDVFDGLTPRLERGKLGLQEKAVAKDGEGVANGKQDVVADGEKAEPKTEGPTANGNDPVGWPTEVQAH